MLDVQSSDRRRAILNLVLAVSQVAATGLFLTGVGPSIAEQSSRTGSMITPPEWTFSIWAVIYPGMILYAVHGLLPGRLPDDRLRRIGAWTAVAMAANTAWAVVTIVYGFILPAFLLIVVMLIALLGAYSRLVRPGESLAWRDRVFVVFPVSVFAAWISAATIVNGESWLRNVGLFPTDLLPDATWNAVLALCGAALASTVILLNRGNVFYAAAFCWALSGVAARSAQLPDPVGLAAATAAIGVVIGTFIGVSRTRRVSAPA